MYLKLVDSEIEYAGPYCMRYGISTTWLLLLLHAYKDECVHGVLISLMTALLLRSHYQCQIALRKKQDAPCVLETENRSCIKDCMHFLLCLYSSVDPDGGDLSSFQRPVEYQELHVASSPNKETGREFYLCQGAVL